jgi:hypothetical protein
MPGREAHVHMRMTRRLNTILSDTPELSLFR